MSDELEKKESQNSETMVLPTAGSAVDASKPLAESIKEAVHEKRPNDVAVEESMHVENHSTAHNVNNGTASISPQKVEPTPPVGKPVAVEKPHVEEKESKMQVDAPAAPKAETKVEEKPTQKVAVSEPVVKSLEKPATETHEKFTGTPKPAVKTPEKTASPEKPAVPATPDKPAAAPPVEKMETSPAKQVEKSPEKVVEMAPVKAVEKPPVKPVEKSPVKPAEKLPIKPVEKSPIKPVEKSPVKPIEKSPVKPVETMEEKEDAKEKEVPPEKRKAEEPTEESPKPKRARKSPAKTPLKSDDDSEEMEMEVLKPGTLEQPVLMTGKRERKKVERLSSTYTPPAEKSIEIPEGNGTKLGECPRVDHFLSKTSVDELKPLVKIIFGRIGKETMIKKNLRQFNGFAFEKDSKEYDKKRTQFCKLTISVLKPICGALDLQKSGKRDELADRVLDFLMKPVDSGEEVPGKKSSGKRKRTSTSDGKAKKRGRRSKAESGEESGSGDEKSGEEEGSDGEEEKEKEKDSDDDGEEEEKEEKKSRGRGRKKAEPKPKKAAPKKKEKSAGKKKDKEPLAPTDDEIKTTVKEILDGANLEEVTMKTVCKQVYEKYPEHDLTDRKDFIKTTVKSLIS